MDGLNDEIHVAHLVLARSTVNLATMVPNRFPGVCCRNAAPEYEQRGLVGKNKKQQPNKKKPPPKKNKTIPKPDSKRHQQ